ncbi:helix-turn-helix domain-containing protein [Pararhizobium sp. IMCC21322]|uniref:helix-turn-helix domain-containing protein n=1 Tax=Pararhizobium sp. IMCC21322 TaxID=3067903 RepID=UPI0027419887|nr:helix-turn-helix transcriptional regulator [Pararhizobium sp. IMCC21322]
MNHGISGEEIGERMKAFRLGAGLTPEQLAQRTGVSRAAIYRYESGQPAKIDTLVKIADLLDVSLPTLLGAGVEYIASAISFFERMRQLEENVDQITVLFGPISYLLTTDTYDDFLPDVLKESIPGNVESYNQAVREVDTLLDILRVRKATYRNRTPNIISLTSAAELTQFLRLGFVGAYNPQGVDVGKRRDVARIEIENIVQLLRNQPIGVQLGVVVDSMPGSSLQIFKQATRKSVAVSPYRLGAFANIRLGVATISSAPDATELYQSVTTQLWTRALKGEQAADFIEKNVLS